MLPDPSKPKVIIFDTTMRDGELMPDVKIDIYQKISIAKLLEEMRVDVIEVGYPGIFRKDFDDLFMVSKQVKESIICGLANSKADEIIDVALAIRPAARGRINVFTPINLNHPSELDASQTLEVIQDSISLARNYCGDVEWSAFDACRSEPDFLCRAIETAINSGATTVTIPDSLGTSSTDEFSELISMVMNRVPNISQVILSVHCHNDLGLALENSIAALNCGARQIECAVNGLGARYGNADLEDVVKAISNDPNYRVDIAAALLDDVSVLVAEVTGISKQRYWV
ncbi:MAG: 2-isopropylmalate synthase [Cyanobacteria bacterium CRU_2_1]|nr:2-isopropylmalate synthase [Cyanobacteria bacterium RU_5_0]NJR59020.1 2-isopropylmalate synthase [Cyanobacteria bacterium CRU_2_1]